MSLIQTTRMLTQTAASSARGILLPVSQQPNFLSRFDDSVTANKAEDGSVATVFSGSPVITAATSTSPSFMHVQAGTAGSTAIGVRIPVAFSAEFTVFVVCKCTAALPDTGTDYPGFAPVVANFQWLPDGSFAGVSMGFYKKSATVLLYQSGSNNLESVYSGGNGLTDAQQTAWGMYCYRVSTSGSDSVISMDLLTASQSMSSTLGGMITTSPYLGTEVIGTDPANSIGSTTSGLDIAMLGYWDSALSDDDMNAVAAMERDRMKTLFGVAV